MPRADNRAPAPISAGKRDRRGIGTIPAINCTGKSDTPFDENHALSGHGGARLRADRTSDHLTFKQARAIMLAALSAERIGQPFTRMVTIHWERAGITDNHAATATGKLTKLMSDWARRRGARVHWAWTRASDKGKEGKGSHLHILIACPRALPIGRMWQRWIKAITGNRYRAGVLDTKSIGGKLSAPITNPAAYRQNLFKVVAYICKGLLPDDAAGLGIKRVEDEGRVIGKRSAVCQLLLSSKDDV